MAVDDFIYYLDTMVGYIFVTEVVFWYDIWVFEFVVMKLWDASFPIIDYDGRSATTLSWEFEFMNLVVGMPW